MIERSHDRRNIAWDIETTGFSWDDQITTSGFWFPPKSVELIINTNGDPVNEGQLESHLEEVSNGVSISVTATDDERELLTMIGRVLFEKFDREFNRLVAFNAESWKRGFDLPFLRTRCIAHEFDWLLDGIQFADLWEPVKKRLNTTYAAHGNSMDINSLSNAHALLFDSTRLSQLNNGDETTTHVWYQDDPYDPFNDSSQAVACYDRGEFTPLLEHNLADIHRTWELGELVRTFVSPKDITTKKL